MAQALFYSSNAVAMTLGAGIASGDTTCNLSSASGLPASFPFKLLIGWGTGQQEVVHCSALSGTTATIARGQDGTTAQSHSIGATVVHGVSAREFNDLELHVGSTAAVHGVTGNVVGTSDVQTLTNKTLSSPVVNTPTITSPTITGAVSIADASGVEIGKVDGTASTPFLDFHSGTAVTDNDFRLIASGGDGSANGGTMKAQGGTFGIEGARAGLVPFYVRQTGSPSVDMAQFQNTGGTPLVKIDNAGNIFATNLTSAWTSYTPAFTNCTTPNGNFAYRLQGKTLFLRGWITAGTATGAGAITISLPAALSGVLFTQLVQAEVAAALQVWTVNGGSPTVITSAAFTAGQSLGAIFSATLEVA